MFRAGDLWATHPKNRFSKTRGAGRIIPSALPSGVLREGQQRKSPHGGLLSCGCLVDWVRVPGNPDTDSVDPSGTKLIPDCSPGNKRKTRFVI